MTVAGFNFCKLCKIESIGLLLLTLSSVSNQKSESGTIEKGRKEKIMTFNSKNANTHQDVVTSQKAHVNMS